MSSSSRLRGHCPSRCSRRHAARRCGPPSYPRCAASGASRALRPFFRSVVAWSSSEFWSSAVRAPPQRRGESRRRSRTSVAPLRPSRPWPHPRGNGRPRSNHLESRRRPPRRRLANPLPRRDPCASCRSLTVPTSLPSGRIWTCKLPSRAAGPRCEPVTSPAPPRRSGAPRSVTDNVLAEDALFWRGIALDRGGRSGPARVALSDFLARYPESDHRAEACVILGWLLIHTGELDEAVDRFEQALQDPADQVRNSARAGLAAARSPRQPQR